ncbi:hypothetical protein C8Q76DRAFT_824102 [Earliella scabrosa]|nr:hypothetical protein C8Q76DRAFT_824102 [Earliella scabrosa]
MLTYSVLKAPLLLGLAVNSYPGMTPPLRPPRPNEKKRASAPDFLAGLSNVQRVVIGATKQMPPSSILSGALSTFIPRSLLSADTSSLRLTPVAVAHRHTGRVAVRDDHKLIIEGPYNIVRHPSYTGWYCVIAGNLLLLYSKGSLFVESGLLGTLVGKAVAACMTVYMGWTEDELLRKEFGTEWEEWARKTPYRLIPAHSESDPDNMYEKLIYKLRGNLTARLPDVSSASLDASVAFKPSLTALH